MPLITCPDCQTEISDAAPSCIKCGRPMEEWERNAIKAQKEKLAEEKLAEEKLAEEKLAEEKLTNEKLTNEKLTEEKLAKKKLAKKNNTQYILVIAGMLLAFFFASTSSSDDSSTSTSTSTSTTAPRSAPPAKATPTPKVTPTPTPRVYTPTPTPTLCLKVAPSVIRTLNARARYGAQLDVNSGWAIKRTSAYSDGHFIAAKYTAPAAKKGRVDAFYTDTIASPTYILPASQAATMAFPSTFSFTVKELIGNPEGFQEYYDAVECAMR